MRLLSFAELKSAKGIPYSRAHTHRLIKADRFPRPLKIGGPHGHNAWPEHEIDQYLESLIAERDGKKTAA